MFRHADVLYGCIHTSILKDIMFTFKMDDIKIQLDPDFNEC